MTQIGTSREVTSEIHQGSVDGQLLDLRGCVCGATFEPWSFAIKVFDRHPVECPHCHRKLFFVPVARVYEFFDDR